MNKDQQILSLQKKLGAQAAHHHQMVCDNAKIREELNLIKRAAQRNAKGWYLEYLQKALASTERQYDDLQERFHKLSAKYSHEMAKRQYVWTSNPQRISKAEDHFDHTESEQI